MGLQVIERLSETALVNLTYEGLAAAPPFLGPEEVSLSILSRPRFVSVRTVCEPGNVDLILSPRSSNERAGSTRYHIRDGSIILLDGTVDYDASLQLVANGAVSATGAGANALLCCPIPSGQVRLNWGSDIAPVINAPDDQGAICPAIRAVAVAGAGGTCLSDPILVPQSGRASWIAEYTAGATGEIHLIQGPLTTSQSVALAPVGVWTVPDLIAGQFVRLRFRNTTVGAVAASVDLKVVRTCVIREETGQSQNLESQILLPTYTKTIKYIQVRQLKFILNSKQEDLFLTKPCMIKNLLQQQNMTLSKNGFKPK